MFSVNKLVTKSIIFPDLTRSISFARGKRLGGFNYYQSIRAEKSSTPNPNNNPSYRYHGSPYQFHHRRGGFRPKVIIGMIVLGFIAWKYVHKHKDHTRRSRDKGSSDGTSDNLTNLTVQNEDQSWKT